MDIMMLSPHKMQYSSAPYICAILHNLYKIVSSYHKSCFSIETVHVSAMKHVLESDV